jgi:hypothetical protein
MTQPQQNPATIPAPFILNPPDGTMNLPPNDLRVDGTEGLEAGSTFNVILVDPNGISVNPGPGSNIPAPNGNTQAWIAVFSGLQGATWYTCMAYGRTPANTTYVDARSYKTAAT